MEEDILNKELAELLIQDNVDENNNYINVDVNQNSKEYHDMIENIRKKKIQMLLRRDPTNVLILESIDQQTSHSVQTIVEQYLLQSCLNPLVIVRYISMLRSLVLVFIHRNDSQSCKLLLERQSIVKKSFIIYFGKELSQEAIKRHQLCPPFATRQFLISPPLSPPQEWGAPGDGLESAPVAEPDSTHFSGFDPQQLNDRLKVIYQDQTTNGFPSITLEFCT